MKQLLAIGGGLAVGAAVMLVALQPWKRGERTAPAEKSDPREEALRLVLLAEAALASRQFTAAQQRLAEAAGQDPGLFEIPLLQGHLEMARGEWSAARRSYTEALKRKPRDPDALSGRAAARFHLKEHAGAVEDATAAIQDEPDALFTRASAYKELGRLEESLRDWTAYLTRRPRDAQAWMNRGNVHARMGRKSGAATDWERAVALDSGLKDQLTPLIEEAKR